MKSQPFKRKAPDELRRSALAKLHCWRRDSKLDEPAYRAFLNRLTGKESAAELDAHELGRVLDEVRRLGFRSPRTIANEGGPAGPQKRLAIALWRELGDLGALHDPSDNGLRKFAARLTGIDRMEWADARQMNQIIEGLKAWKRREQLKQAAI